MYLGILSLNVKMNVIDHEPQGHFGHLDLGFYGVGLVHITTCNRFDLEPKHLHQIYKLVFSQLVLKTGVIDFDHRGHLAIVLTQETAFNVALIY